MCLVRLAIKHNRKQTIIGYKIYRQLPGNQIGTYMVNLDGKRYAHSTGELDQYCAESWKQIVALDYDIIPEGKWLTATDGMLSIEPCFAIRGTHGSYPTGFHLFVSKKTAAKFLASISKVSGFNPVIRRVIAEQITAEGFIDGDYKTVVVKRLLVLPEVIS